MYESGTIRVQLPATSETPSSDRGGALVQEGVTGTATMTTFRDRSAPVGSDRSDQRRVGDVRGSAGNDPSEVRSEVIDDHELVRRFADGDERAFDALVRLHTDAAWRMARSLLRDDFLAEEAVQDTFLKAYRNLHVFRGESKVSTWLLSICHRTCIDKVRGKKVETVPLDDHVRRLQRPAERTDLRVAIEGALERLPDEEREAFSLVEMVGHSREEAAGIVGVPASTMRSRVRRAREKLARALADARDEAMGG